MEGSSGGVWHKPKCTSRLKSQQRSLAGAKFYISEQSYYSGWTSTEQMTYRVAASLGPKKKCVVMSVCITDHEC